MINRERITDEGEGQYEYYAAYRQNQKQEARVLQVKLKGKWVWRSFFAFDVSTVKDLPPSAKVFEFDKKKRVMVLAKTVGRRDVQQFVKLPPYVKQGDGHGRKVKRIGAKRRERQREMRHEREQNVPRKARPDYPH